MKTKYLGVLEDQLKERAMHYLTQDEITILKNFCTIKKYLKDLKTPIHLNSIVREGGLMDMALKVCIYYGITFDEFVSPRRDKYLVDARTDFCHLAKETTRFGCNQIGRFINRDHTSVLHHWKKQPVCLDDMMNGGDRDESENK